MQQKQKLYVGSLPYKTTEDDLKEIFSQYGTVVGVKVVTDRVTGQSKGFGFVEMANEKEAQDAISGVNGSSLDERTLVVSIARPPQPREEGGGGGGGGWQKSRRSRNY